MKAWDYVVVGAGTAGCVVASRISADPSRRVLLIEAGGGDRDPILHVPGGSLRNSTTPRYNWSFTTEQVPALADRRLFWAQGKVVGGSSTINGMIYARGHRSEYDAWRDAGCAGWGFDDLLPLFRKTETNERGASFWHGGDGPLNVSRGRPSLPICNLVLEAAERDGFAIRDDFNAEEQEGFGHFDCTIHRGRRQSAATAFLGPARRRPNFAVLRRAHVVQVTFEGHRATGVIVRAGGRLQEIRASHEVILAAGAVNSPQLLMLSGIGASDHLRQHGIAVRHDAPEVGRNLQNHVAWRMQLACDAPITAYRHVSVTGAARAGFEYLAFRRGVLADSIVPTGGFLRTQPGLAATDIQVQLGVGLIGRVGKSLWQRLPKEHGFSLSLNQGRPWSRGEVRLRSGDPLADPLIDPRYFDDPRDMATLLDGIERLRSIVSQRPIAGLVTRYIQPHASDLSRASLEESVRRNASTAFHPVGTCRMGGDANSVVDPTLRVRGVEGLRVADASVMPLLMNANTNAASFMVGEKAADMILAG